MRIVRYLWIACFFVTVAHAEGVWKVAGRGFHSDVAGKPITWRGGLVHYRTDQGDLSATITGAQADDAVAWAFQQWTAAAGGALTAVNDGKLAEDISPENTTGAGDVWQLPPDADATAGERLIVIYDYDGSLTELIDGPGAGDASACSTDAVHYWADAYSDDGYFEHVILVLNGNCFPDATQLRYALVRAVGRVLGLGGSQLNDNVVTSPGTASAEDLAGWPIMHPGADWCGSNCPSDMNLRVDDVAAISHLYPAPSFHVTTGTITGRVFFADGTGMAGVNVVARLIDPSTGARSRSVALSCVSGYLHAGRVGNPVSGFTDADGSRYDRFGSTDPALAGYYEIAGVPLPYGAATQYEISVEPINPDYVGQEAAGPYTLAQIAPSGSATAAIVGVSGGTISTHDILMDGSASGSGSTPTAIPAAGFWTASLDQSAAHALPFRVRAGRAFTLEITALDEQQQPTGQKLLPEIGAWDQATDVNAAPDLSAAGNGTVQLTATFSYDDALTFVVADQRGESRPDFLYRARLLYADHVLVTRSGANTILRITGLGFTNDVTVAVAGTRANILSLSANRIVASLPTPPDGSYDIVLLDRRTGATATLFLALSIGDAGANVVLASPPYSNAYPVGAATPPLLFRATDHLGSPLPGQPILLAVSGGNTLTACGASSCVVQANEAGEVGTGVLLNTAGSFTLTATLPDGAAAAAAVNATQGTPGIYALTPQVWIGASSGNLIVPVTMAVASGSGLTFRNGGATSTVTSNVYGMATFLASIAAQPIGSSTNITACLVSSTSSCAQTKISVVDANAEALAVLQGSDQSLLPGDALVQIVLRVTDNSGNPIFGAKVSCNLLALRPETTDVLASTLTVVTTAEDGTLTLPVPQDYLTADLDLKITATLANGAIVHVSVTVRTTVQ